MTAVLNQNNKKGIYWMEGKTKVRIIKTDELGYIDGYVYNLGLEAAVIIKDKIFLVDVSSLEVVNILKSTKKQS